MSNEERTPLLAKPPRSPADYSTAQKWRLLAMLVFLPLLSSLDMTMVAALTAPISSDFSSSENSSWLGSAYLLSVCVASPVYSRLVDILGRRGAMLTASTIFGLGTVGCTIAPSMYALIFARFVAGLGGGGLQVTMIVVANDLFSLKERGVIQGVLNVVFGFGAAVGAPIGGVFSDTVGWRYAFLFQIPLIVCTSVGAYFGIRYEMSTKKEHEGKTIWQRIDWGGSITLLIWVAALLFALSFKTNQLYAWTSPLILSCLAVAVIFLGLFIFVESRTEECIMPIRLVKERSLACMNIGNFVVSFTWFSTLYFLPLLFEIVLSQSSSRSGAHLTPLSISISFASLLAGFIMRRTGDYKWLLVFGHCLPLIAWIGLASFKQSWPTWTTWVIGIPETFGVNFGLTANLIGILATVEKTDTSVATGMSYLFRFVGQILGVALSFSVLQAQLVDELKQRFPGSNELIEQIRHRADVVKTLQPEQRRKAQDAYLAALHAVFSFNGAVTCIALVAALFIVPRPLADSSSKQDEERAGAEE